MKSRIQVDMKNIAYFINQYPKVSHSFIRREILALEAQGITVHRYAVRGWADDVADSADQAEKARTQYVLQDGVFKLFLAAARMALEAPAMFLRALGLSLRMASRADRPWPYHLIYLAEACRLLPWLRTAGVQHVHAHFGTNSTEVVMLVHSLGGPGYSFTVHGPEEFDKPEFLHLGEKIRRSRFVVAISSYGRSQLYRWVGNEHWNKVAVVHCGLEVSFHSGAQLPIPGSPRLVCVGRLCEQKGQLLLLQALRDVLNLGVSCELVLAGNGEMRTQIEALALQLGVSNAVRITGWIDGAQVREEVLNARALVLPSFAEGLPVVIMESLALGRPVITTSIAGIPELVEHGRSGWLVPAGDKAALVAAMCEALSAETAKLAAMGQYGRQRVLQRHNVDTEASKLVELFNSVSKC